jgi:hypothetical protein
LSGRNPSDKKFEGWIRLRVKIHSKKDKIFQSIRSRRSSALVIREDLSKFFKPEDLEEAE